MPRQVDHEERRQTIAQAVARLAASRGLQDVSFREVAAEADMSVALIQHYFGTKHNMLVGTLKRVSTAMGDRIIRRVTALGADAAPLDQIREMAATFIPVDPAGREAMLVYHGFAAAALTDPDLRSTETFGEGWRLIDLFAQQFRRARELGDVDAEVDPDVEGIALISLVVGLSMNVLLQQVSPSDAMKALDNHLRLLEV